jgi:hypothetical protein
VRPSDRCAWDDDGAGVPCGAERGDLPHREQGSDPVQRYHHPFRPPSIDGPMVVDLALEVARRDGQIAVLREEVASVRWAHGCRPGEHLAAFREDRPGAGAPVPEDDFEDWPRDKRGNLR